MNQLLSQFLKFLGHEIGRSPQTVANYDFYLTRFLAWSKITDPKRIDANLIKNYQLWLGRQTDRFGQPLKQTTQNYHLIALRTFLKYLKQQKKSLTDFSEVRLSRAVSHTSRALSANELEEMLGAPLKAKDKTVRLRDKALLEILFSTGLKVAGLSQLKKDDIGLDDGVIILDQAKSKYKLSNQGKYYLKQYIALRRDGSPYLFVREDKAKGDKPPLHLTPRSIQRIIKNYANICGIKTKVTPQVIRQTAVIYRLN